jgi:hypothetical protein
MSLIPGNFTQTELNAIRVKQNELQFGSRTELQVKPESVGTMTAIQQVQTASINQLFNGQATKDNKVEVIFLNACEVNDQALQDCFTSSPKLSSSAYELELSKTREVPFMVSETDLRDNSFTFEDAVARGLQRVEKKLIENIQRQIIVNLNLFAGVNEFDGGRGTVVGNLTEVPAAAWDSSMYAYLSNVMDINRFDEGAFLSANMTLREYYVNALFNQGNADGKGTMSAFSSMPTFFDFRNMNAINTPDNISYLIAQGAVAFASKQVYDTTPQRYHDHDRFSYESEIVPGLWINVIMKDVCESNFVAKTVKAYVKYDLFSNPVACEADNTGVLAFKTI